MSAVTKVPAAGAVIQSPQVVTNYTTNYSYSYYLQLNLPDLGECILPFVISIYGNQLIALSTDSGRRKILGNASDPWSDKVGRFIVFPFSHPHHSVPVGLVGVLALVLTYLKSPMPTPQPAAAT